MYILSTKKRRLIPVLATLLLASCASLFYPAIHTGYNTPVVITSSVTNPLITPLHRQCNNGYIHACHDLAMLYHAGQRGVIKNVPLAMQFFSRACEAGNVASCFKLGQIYEKWQPEHAGYRTLPTYRHQEHGHQERGHKEHRHQEHKHQEHKHKERGYSQSTNPLDYYLKACRGGNKKACVKAKSIVSKKQ